MSCSSLIQNQTSPCEQNYLQFLCPKIQLNPKQMISVSHSGGASLCELSNLPDTSWWWWDTGAKSERIVPFTPLDDKILWNFKEWITELLHVQLDQGGQHLWSIAAQYLHIGWGHIFLRICCFTQVVAPAVYGFTCDNGPLAFKPMLVVLSCVCCFLVFFQHCSPSMLWVEICVFALVDFFPSHFQSAIHVDSAAFISNKTSYIRDGIWSCRP